MTKQEIKELLSHTEQGKIAEFIAEHAAEDKQFCEKIKKALLPDDDDDEICDIDYYRIKAEDCFGFDGHFGRSSRGYDYYDFYESAYQAAKGLDSILSDATFYVEQGKYTDAAAMAMSVAEIIPQKSEEVDDSGGALGDTFGTAIKLLCDIVNNPNVNISIKQEIYDWSKEITNESVYVSYGFDTIDTIYKICCEQLGDTDEVLAEIERKIKEANPYQKKDAVLWKIRFMQSRNMDVQDVIQTYIDIDNVRKIRFEQLKNAKEYDEALRLAEKGIEIAQQNRQGTVTNWQKSMFDIYLLQENTTKLLQMAEYLFLHAGWGQPKDEFYNALKKYTSIADWTNTLERLFSAAEKKDHFDSFTARIMHEHQLWARLFAYCQKGGGISEMEHYEKDLKPHFEKEILEYYKVVVEKRARITDSNAYREVARILTRMRTFTDGHELVNQLLEKYRTTYKRRKNMMKELINV